MSYEAKIGTKAPFENVNMVGERKASRSTDGKFYGHMKAEEGMRENPFAIPAVNAVRIGGFTQDDYGNLKAVYKDQGTAKVFGKGY